jgi:hypothetical protein
MDAELDSSDLLQTLLSSDPYDTTHHSQGSTTDVFDSMTESMFLAIPADIEYNSGGPPSVRWDNRTAFQYTHIEVWAIHSAYFDH